MVPIGRVIKPDFSAEAAALLTRAREEPFDFDSCCLEAKPLHLSSCAPDSVGNYRSVSAMISAHRATHSSQMKTWFGPSSGPPIMCRIALLGLQQNEQRGSP